MIDLFVFIVFGVIGLIGFSMTLNAVGVIYFTNFTSFGIQVFSLKALSGP